MGVLFGVVLPLGLMASLIPPAVRQLRGPAHPARLLTEALAAGFVLLVCTLLVPMSWWLQILWWLTLLTAVAALVVSTRRSLKATGEGLQVQGRQGRPVGRREFAVNAALWTPMLVAALFGG